VEPDGYAQVRDDGILATLRSVDTLGDRVEIGVNS
jgi:hypothetical protein